MLIDPMSFKASVSYNKKVELANHDNPSNPMRLPAMTLTRSPIWNTCDSMLMGDSASEANRFRPSIWWSGMMATGR